MTYATIEASPAEGRPYFLYQLRRASPAEPLFPLPAWKATGLALHQPGDGLDQRGQRRRGDHLGARRRGPWRCGADQRDRAGRLELTWPLSHPFARRFLAPMGNTPVTLTIFRGHEQVLGETVAHWKGRVVGAEVEGQRILLQAESVFSTLRRAGVRAKYQRLCRHALYGRGCGLDIALHWLTGTVISVAANAVTIPEAADQPDGWYRGGVLRFGAQLGFITGHAGQ